MPPNAPSNSLIYRAALVIAVAVALNITGPLTALFPSLKGLRLFSTTPNDTIILYGLSTSTCTRRVATVLKEKGVAYELVPIDFAKMEHKSLEYVSTKQPFGQVPVLQDGDFILYESRAISRYISMKYASQGTPLIPSPRNLTKWAMFEEAASVEQNNFDPFVSGIASELVFKPMRGGQTDHKRVEELKATLRMKLEGYERILNKHRYLAGDEITLVDLFHLPYGTMVTEQLGMDIILERPNVARWWKDISSRPSWGAVKNGA